MFSLYTLCYILYSPFFYQKKKKKLYSPFGCMASLYYFILHAEFSFSFFFPCFWNPWALYSEVTHRMVIFTGSARISFILRKSTTNGGDIVRFMKLNPRVNELLQGSVAVSSLICSNCPFWVFGIAEGECISWEAWPAWMSILHEDWRLQVWCRLSVSSSQRKSNSCSRLCLESNRPPITPGELWWNG